MFFRKIRIHAFPFLHKCFNAEWLFKINTNPLLKMYCDVWASVVRPAIACHHHDPPADRWECWRETWEKRGTSTRWRWTVFRPRCPTWRTSCLSCAWTCNATRPSTNSCCASSRTWRWRSPPTGGCWRERKCQWGPRFHPQHSKLHGVITCY